MLPALRCLGNFITGSDIETQQAIDAGIVQELGQLLASPRPTVKKEACWALSNIAAGTASQIQILFNEGLMGKIIKLAAEDVFDVRRECIWAISNASSGVNPDQLRGMLELGAIESLCSILATNDARTLAIALEGIENLIHKTKSMIGDVFFINSSVKIETSRRSDIKSGAMRRLIIDREITDSFKYAYL